MESDLPKEWEEQINCLICNLQSDLSSMLEMGKRTLTQHLISKIRNSQESYSTTDESPSRDMPDSPLSELNGKRKAFYLIQNFENLNLKKKMAHEINKLLNSFSLVPESDIPDTSHPLILADNNFEVQQVISAKNGIWDEAIEYIENRNVIIIGDGSGNLSVWDANDYRRLSINRSSQDWIYSVRYSKKTDSLYVGYQIGKIKVFKLDNHNRLRLVKTVNFPNSIFTILVLDHLDLLVCSGRDLPISLFKLSTMTSLGNIDNEETGVFSFCYLPSYEFLIAPYFGGEIVVYDLKNRKEYMRALGNYEEYYADCLTYIEDREMLFASCGNGTIYCWNLNLSHKRLVFLRKIQFNGEALASLIPINNNRILLYSSYDQPDLYCYDIENEETYSIWKADIGLGPFRFIPNKKSIVIGASEEDVAFIVNYSPCKSLEFDDLSILSSN